MRDEVIREVALPADFSICYIQAALIVGLQSLGNSRNFHEIAGTLNTAEQMKSAEYYLTTFLRVVNDLKEQVFIDSQSNPQRSSTTPFPTEGAEGTTGSGDGGGEDINPLL